MHIGTLQRFHASVYHLSEQSYLIHTRCGNHLIFVVTCSTIRRITGSINAKIWFNWICRACSCALHILQYHSPVLRRILDSERRRNQRQCSEFLVDFMRWFTVAFHANGVFIGTHGGIELTTPVCSTITPWHHYSL